MLIVSPGEPPAPAGAGAPVSSLTTATRMFSVAEYGSQKALMLNQAYNDGVMRTPNTMA